MRPEEATKAAHFKNLHERTTQEKPLVSKQPDFLAPFFLFVF
jgi:hypothetical protein